MKGERAGLGNAALDGTSGTARSIDRTSPRFADGALLPPTANAAVRFDRDVDAMTELPLSRPVTAADFHKFRHHPTE
ncbi:hypothetical protein QLQ15_00045 [Lysobacter sp. LF1]|uniref:Uncharacterized protein n=1 Tax=Lysobacter stagni TaxID=3045172 RepID=A0ABT6XBL1_9GAMM|nr:hypothetical protein [Lysobacter sp. LF1]MDI9237303.1 hypothetical protein [Lysobacter sp. LF1]